MHTGDPDPPRGPGHPVPQVTEHHRDTFLGWKLDAEVPGSGLSLGPTQGMSTGCRTHARHQRSAEVTAHERGHRGPTLPLGDWTLAEIKSGQHAVPQCKK